MLCDAKLKLSSLRSLSTVMKGPSKISFMSQNRIPFYSCLFIGWLFVIYEYALRVSDGVVLPMIQAQFHLQASSLSTLSSTYYFAYIISMVPAGLIIDRLGIYRAWLGALALVLIGSMLFGSAHTFSMLIIARILMGVGSAFAVIGTFALAISRKYTGMLIGITMAVGMVGAIIGQGPWESMTIYFGSWHITYWASGYIGVSLLIVWAIIGRTLPKTALPKMQIVAFRQTFSTLLRSRFFWLMAIFIGCLSSPQTVFTALWGPRFLASQFNFNAIDSAYINSTISLGGIFGGLILGWLGDFFEDAKWLLIIIGGLVALLMSYVLIGHIGDQETLISTLFIIGFLTNANVIVFAHIGKFYVKLSHSTIQGCTNLFNMGVGPILQVAIGIIISLQTPIVSQQLSADHMRNGLWLIPICVLVTTALLILLPIGSEISRAHRRS